VEQTVDRSRVDKGDLYTSLAFVLYECLKDGLSQG
jgi:hypothetical protein